LPKVCYRRYQGPSRRIVGSAATSLRNQKKDLHRWRDCRCRWACLCYWGAVLSLCVTDVWLSTSASWCQFSLWHAVTVVPLQQLCWREPQRPGRKSMQSSIMTLV